MADTEGVDVGERPHGLVGVELNQQDGDGLFHLVIMFQHTVHGLWDVVHDHVQVDFVGLHYS